MSECYVGEMLINYTNTTTALLPLNVNVYNQRQVICKVLTIKNCSPCIMFEVFLLSNK